MRSGTRRGSVAGTDAASGRDSNQTEKSLPRLHRAVDSDSFRSARQTNNQRSVRDPSVSSGCASHLSIGAISVVTCWNVGWVHVRPDLEVELSRARLPR